MDTVTTETDGDGPALRPDHLAAMTEKDLLCQLEQEVKGSNIADKIGSIFAECRRRHLQMQVQLHQNGTFYAMVLRATQRGGYHQNRWLAYP